MLNMNLIEIQASENISLLLAKPVARHISLLRYCFKNM